MISKQQADVVLDGVGGMTNLNIVTVWTDMHDLQVVIEHSILRKSADIKTGYKRKQNKLGVMEYVACTGPYCCMNSIGLFTRHNHT